MKKYTLYFEFYGHKMRTTINAKSENEAKEIVKNNLEFKKVIEEPIEKPDIFEQLQNIVNGKC